MALSYYKNIGYMSHSFFFVTYIYIYVCGLSGLKVSKGPCGLTRSQEPAYIQGWQLPVTGNYR